MRSITLSNGEILVNLDQFGQVRDFYYPYIGLENHVLNHAHKIGIWVDGEFSWFEGGTWKCNCHFQKGTMVGETVFSNENLKLQVSFIDAVDTNKNIFIRKIVIKNDGNTGRDIRLFFYQVFEISEHRLANTAFFDPVDNTLIHYKGRRVFLINGMDSDGNPGIDDWTIGVWGYNGQEGSFYDAEDGVLSKNAVEHGPVDSIVSLHEKVKAGEAHEVHYWIAVGETLEAVAKLNRRVIKRSPRQIIEVSSNFWKAWVSKRKIDYHGLSEPVINLYQRSLLIVRSHIDNRGGVIASSDSASLAYRKEGYAFVWPRDGALSTMALDNAGYTEVTRPFFDFIADVITDEGYVHHKYLSDRSLGSTWHASIDQQKWLEQRELQLPIQEDETASVVFALWNHYNHSRDIEMVERLYEKIIYPAGNFMIEYRDKNTGLPKESYDLWEEKLGVSTYTAASVYGGLTACSKFAQLLGKKKHFSLYQEAALAVKTAMIKYLYSQTRQAFIRTVKFKTDGLQYEEIIDSSSLFALWFFGVLAPEDPLFISTKEAVNKYLVNQSPIGGVIRYENDDYYKQCDKSNPWFINTMWGIQLEIHEAKSVTEVKEAIHKLHWVVKHTTDSGVLAEQLHPYTGEPLSVCPLTWSHSEFINTVVMYLEKMEMLSGNSRSSTAL